MTSADSFIELGSNTVWSIRFYFPLKMRNASAYPGLNFRDIFPSITQVAPGCHRVTLGKEDEKTTNDVWFSLFTNNGLYSKDKFQGTVLFGL